MAKVFFFIGKINNGGSLVEKRQGMNTWEQAKRQSLLMFEMHSWTPKDKTNEWSLLRHGGGKNEEPSPKDSAAAADSNLKGARTCSTLLGGRRMQDLQLRDFDDELVIGVRWWGKGGTREVQL